MSKETAMALMGAQTNAPAPIAAAAAPTATDPAVAPAATPGDAGRLAIFAKKEAAIQKQQAELKAEREALAKEKEISDAYKKRGTDFDDMFKKDKKAALRMLGLSDTDIINILADQEEDETETAEEAARRIAQEEAQKVRDELKTQKEKDEHDANEKIIAKLKTDLTEKIKADPDRYEYCAFEGVEAELQAYEIIVENLKENGDLLSVEEALDLAENYYESRDKAMANLKKRQPKTAEVQAETPAPAVEPTRARGGSTGLAPTSNTPAKPTTTLSNRVTATTTGAAHVAKKETPSEKRERLIEQLRKGAA